MTFSINNLVIIYGLTTLILLLNIYQTWLMRFKKGGLELMHLLSALTLWVFFATLEAAAMQFQMKIFFSKISMIWSTLSPVLFFLFILRYTDNEHLIEVRYRKIFWIVPILTIFFAFSNDQINLLWPQITPLYQENMLQLEFAHSLWFWVYMAHSYLLLLLAFILLMISVYRLRFIHSIQTMILLIPFFLVIVVNILSVMGIRFFHGMDLTPITFSLIGIVLNWGLRKIELSNLTPIAKDLIVEKMRDSLLVVNNEMCLVDFNESALHLCARVWCETDADPSAIIGKKIDQLFENWPNLVKAFMEEGEVQSEIVCPNSEDQLTCQLNITQLCDARHNPIGKMAILSDITSQKEIIRSEVTARQTAEALQEIAQVISSTLDYDMILSLALDEIKKAIPYDSANISLMEGEFLVIYLVRGFDDPDVAKGLKINFEHSPNKISYERKEPLIFNDVQKDFPNYRKVPHNNTRSILTIPMLIKNEPIGSLTLDSRKLGAFDAQQLPIASAFAAQLAIALENSRLFEQMANIAIRDPLIGIYNRRYFMERALVEFERSKRYEHSLTLILMDLDRFKDVNDTYGHQVGDQALILAAKACEEVLRNADIFARYGGEEFIFMLPETSLEEGLQVAERLRQAVSEARIKTRSGFTRVMASFGVASIRAECFYLDDLLSDTDEALYQAKAAGRNRVCSR